MTDDKIENLNEHRLRKVVDDLETDKDIIKFARWVNDHVTDEFSLTSDYGMNYDSMIHDIYPKIDGINFCHSYKELKAYMNIFHKIANTL